MVLIQDRLLHQLARAARGQTFEIMDKAAYSENDTPTGTDVGNFGVEVGDRVSTTLGGTNGTVRAEVIRTGLMVVDGDNGDTIERIGFLADGEDAPLVIAELPGIVHTNKFDLSFVLELDVERK